MNNLVSVIVPAYNVEKYLSRCLDSILAQTYKYIEVIIVDDGATDKTGEIADQYAKRFKNIRCIHKKMVDYQMQGILGWNVFEENMYFL